MNYFICYVEVIEMDELFDIEISDIDIKAMVEMNQDIKNLSEVEIKNKCNN